MVNFLVMHFYLNFLIILHELTVKYCIYITNEQIKKTYVFLCEDQAKSGLKNLK